MNSLWPATSRSWCIKPWINLSICHKADSLAARLAQRSTRSYSKCSLHISWKETGSLKTKPCSRTYATSNPLTSFGLGPRTFASRRIITKYEQLPEDYKDEDGIPFRAEPLRKGEVLAIFGKGVDVSSANRILSVLHGRRVAGTLDEPAAAASAIDPFELQAREIGLSWLRKNVIVDEVRSAGLHAEKELAKMQAEILADSDRIGLYKSDYPPRKSVYGESGLDAIRKTYEQKLDDKEQEEQRMSHVDEIRHNTGPLEEIKPASRVELRRPGENPRLKYYLERAKILPSTPPEMSIFQRLWPSGVFVLGVVLGCIVFAQVYSPPKKSARLMPDLPPAAATFTGLFMANLLIFALWRHPPAFRLLNKYFITTPGYPYPFSLVGNIFSHQSFSHFSVNMLVLFFVGTRLHDEVGRGNFLAVYLACGAIGSFASLASWVIRGSFVSSSLGASGALSGIIATYLWLNKGEYATFFGHLPDNWPHIPSVVILALLIGSDLFFVTRFNKAPVTLDHWAHLGGYASGIGAAELLKIKATRRREIEMERRKKEGFVDRIRNGRL